MFLIIANKQSRDQGQLLDKIPDGEASNAFGIS